ncbi:MAG: hypothetical protein LQ347_000184 [Umbilicaria vellea]|nr:MAG: hypothetical protein LQ347_000184 [Umbilicaria vellea]
MKIAQEPFQVYASTRGLRSVPYIVLSNTAMTDACALHLSYVLVSHNFPEQLVARVPPVKAGPPQHQLEVYDITSGCQGLVYLPNDKLGIAGSRVLELGELAREGFLDETSYEETQEEFETTTKPARALRRESDVWPSPSFSAPSGRRRSATSVAGSEYDGRSSYSATASTELDRARSRIQGNVLRDFGASSVDLWRVSLKMLTLSRAILLSAAERTRHVRESETESYGLRQMPPPAQPPQPPQPAQPAQPVQHLWPVFSTDLNDGGFPPLPSSSIRAGVAPPRRSETTPLKSGNPSHPVTSRHVHRPKKSVNPTARLSGFEPPTMVDTNVVTSRTDEQQPYRSHLPYGFSEDIWMRIISIVAGADGIVNITQQRSILRWAMDSMTLIKEREALGKPKSAQIWRLLEGIGCLAYDLRA